MNATEIQEAVKKVMGENPIDICVRYYEGLIQMSADRIAQEQKEIHELQKRIAELKAEL